MLLTESGIDTCQSNKKSNKKSEEGLEGRCGAGRQLAKSATRSWEVLYI